MFINVCITFLQCQCEFDFDLFVGPWLDVLKKKKKLNIVPEQTGLIFRTR